MFAVDCPYCEYKNERGARFCAHCGAPLHLKPCPGCGKVDDVTATQCSGCGAAFPPIDLAEFGAPASGAPAADTTAEAPGRRMVEPPKAHYRAGPLIAIAIVAGGLPILWINRAHMPLPKAWQIDGPNATGSAVAPPGAAAMPPAAAPVAKAPPPAPEPPPATVSPPARTAEPVAEAPTPAPAKASETAEEPAKAKNKAKTRKNAERTRQKTTEPAPPAPAAADRPCTQALVALGLCKESEIKK